MRLVVDTSVLIGELLRARGRQRLHDERLDLFLPQQMWAETRLHVPRRVAAFAHARGLASGLADELTRQCLVTVVRNTVIVASAVYSALEDEARARSQRDPDDWPVVACALALSAGVWTNDNDFLGTGVATWTTETLQLWLDRADPPR
jgi:predicted nucleic acid-binding protein